MSLFKLLDWWGETPVAHAMNSAVWMFPAVEILHMIGIVLLVGLAAIVDLRLLGVRLTNTPVSVLSAELAPWTTTFCGETCASAGAPTESALKASAIAKRSALK